MGAADSLAEIWWGTPKRVAELRTPGDWTTMCCLWLVQVLETRGVGGPLLDLAPKGEDVCIEQLDSALSSRTSRRGGERQ